MIFRPSQNLNTKIKAGPLAAAPLDENPYADWSAQLFTVNRVQYILLSNTASLYSTVMYGRGVTDHHEFITQALASIRDFMCDDGLELIYRQFIEPAGGMVRFCKRLNRSVTASMNRLVAEAKACLAEDDLSPHDTAARLNGFLLSSLASEASPHYGTPGDAFRCLRP